MDAAPRIRATAPRASPGERVVYPLVALNCAVTLAWKAAPSSPLMWSFFTSGGAIPRSPLARITSPLLATFSHSSALHLACNMAGLASVGPLVVNGRETPASPRLTPREFLGLYGAAGVLASLGAARFSARSGTGRPGLGASGALFGMLAFFAAAHPDASLMLFFVARVPAGDAMLLATTLNAALVAQEALAARGRAPPPAIDGVAHLVGTAVGYAAFHVAAARARERARISPGARRAPPAPPHAPRVVRIPVPPGASVDV